MQTCYLISYHDYTDGSVYPIVIVDSYENAARMVEIDFRDDFLPAHDGDQYTLVFEDGDYLVKNPKIEPTESDPYGNIWGSYKIEYMNLYEGQDIDELESGETS